MDFSAGLDDYWVSKAKNSFAYQGVALFDANGASKVKGIAESLKELPTTSVFSPIQTSRTNFPMRMRTTFGPRGVTVTMWDGGLCIETRVFADLPWLASLAAFEAAYAIHGDRDRLLNQVESNTEQVFGVTMQRGRTDQPCARPLERLPRPANGSNGKAGRRNGWPQSLAI